jgi:hypothetical protein
LKTQLICTFVKNNKIDQTLQKISESFELLNNKVFLLKSVDLENEMILSYNIILDSHREFLPDSILVHRKKETNTIYTINALNDLIMSLNNGVLDKKYPIEWERYKDTMLSKKPDGLKIIRIQIVKTYSI